MRVLWISHVVPYPPTAGVLLRAYNLLKGVAAEHEVDLVAFIQRPLLAPVYRDIDAGIETCRAELAKFCRQVTLLPIPSAERPAGRLRTAAASLLGRHGYVASWLYSPQARKAISAAIRGRQYDLVHLDSISLARYRDLFPGIPATLGHHNAESHMLRRRAANSRNPLAKAFYALEAAKLARLERQIAPDYRLHITCSDLDSVRLAETMPGARFATIPNGVDTQFFKPIGLPERPNSLIFVGTMNWYPNVDAMMFLLRDVWPGLRKAVPDVTLDIVGSGPPASLRELAAQCKGVTVHGFVDDIRPMIDSASLYVCPIMDGGGTKLKILDALAMEKCIVAHPVACEGIAVTDGETAMFASSAGDFVHQIATLLPQSDRRRLMGAAGRRLAVHHYSFDEIGRRLGRSLADVAAAPAPARTDTHGGGPGTGGWP